MKLGWGIALALTTLAAVPPAAASASDGVCVVRNVARGSIPCGTTTRISVGQDGAVANSDSARAQMSGDGRWVVFDSRASNLVSGDTNGNFDVFVYDHLTAKTERVSVSSFGTQGNGSSLGGGISDDGRYVVFMSAATNLVPGDLTLVGYDLFVHDRLSGLTTRVSESTAGVAANGGSYYPSISNDGRYVAFMSFASNLVGGDTNNQSDVFLHDRASGTTSLISIGLDGAPANNESSELAISGDGRFVGFDSWASNLVAGDTAATLDVFVRDLTTGTTTLASRRADGTAVMGYSRFGSVSDNGQLVTFRSDSPTVVARDTNRVEDVFVHDRSALTTVRVSVASDGNQANDRSYGDGTLSGDGRYVAFASYATNLGPRRGMVGNQLFLHDRITGITEELDGGRLPSLSYDGRWVAFSSSTLYGPSDLLGPERLGTEDVFIRDTRPLADRL